MTTHRYYRYGYLLRPPGPGCQPNDGLVRTREQEGATLDGYHLWGFAIYDRPLPEPPEEVNEGADTGF